MTRILAVSFALAFAAATQAHADVGDALKSAGMAAPSHIAATAAAGDAAPVATAPSVQITTFVKQPGNTHLAELCGKVTGGGAMTLVKISVDPDSGKPGTYYVVAGPDGLFCTALVTYNDTADATIAVGGQQFTSKPTSATGANPRQ